MTPSDYTEAIERWRAEAEGRLRAEDGWLALAGLFWLQEGESPFGSDSALPIALPEGAAPALAGSIRYDGAAATIHAAPGVTILVNGEPVAERALRSDSGGPPDMVQVGRVVFFLIQRGARLGVRVRDPESPTRREFTGRRWFPVRPEYRIRGRFVPYDPPRTISNLNILGDTEEKLSPGYVAFELDGQTVTLDATSAGDGLFFVFRDATAGHETYGAARFLAAPAPIDGFVELDFNKAVSPPCAFTAYATCPLPPRQNVLAVRIAAGELAPEVTKDQLRISVGPLSFV